VQPYIRLRRQVIGEIRAEGNRLLAQAFGVGDPVVNVAS
jgi:hypothetical protein